MKKIVVALAITLFCATASAENDDWSFPLDQLEHHAAISIRLPLGANIPLPWDAYAVGHPDAQECLASEDEQCYFIPGVDQDTVFFTVGRHMHAAGHRLISESGSRQTWGLFPVDHWHAVQASLWFWDAGNGTIVVVR